MNQNYYESNNKSHHNSQHHNQADKNSPKLVKSSINPTCKSFILKLSWKLQKANKIRYCKKQ